MNKGNITESEVAVLAAAGASYPHVVVLAKLEE